MLKKKNYHKNDYGHSKIDIFSTTFSAQNSSHVISLKIRKKKDLTRDKNKKQNE